MSIGNPQNIIGEFKPNTYRVMVELVNTTLSVAGTFDESSISQDYDDLEVHLYSRSDKAAVSLDDIRIVINNDTTATNYDSDIVKGEGGSATSSTNNDNLIGRTSAASAISGDFAWVRIFIPFYTDTGRNKIAVATGGVSALSSYFSITRWDNTNAINRLAFEPTTGTDDFIADSQLKIFGFKEVTLLG